MPTSANSSTATAAPAAKSAGRKAGSKKAKTAASGGAEADGAKKAPALSPAQQALLKLGLKRDIDLALHLPLRYEDETRIIALRNARDGEVAQIEATVISSEIQMRPRRQLVVQVEDANGDQCELRFFSGGRWRR